VELVAIDQKKGRKKKVGKTYKKSRGKKPQKEKNKKK
jgi:hypothetical protein